MKIPFDPKQRHQLDAVNAVVELFDDQPLKKPDFPVIFQTMDTELFAGQARTELGVGLGEPEGRLQRGWGGIFGCHAPRQPALLADQTSTVSLRWSMLASHEHGTQYRRQGPRQSRT